MNRMTAPAPIRIEDIAAHPGFTPLAQIAGIVVDLRYAGRHNFASRVLYAGWDCAWLRREAALGLQEAARALAARQPGLRLLVLDALRPQRVQEAIWRDVEGSPMQHYFAHPARGSIHSFGMAVDVTLVDAAGREADMGSAFDEMNETSHSALHAELLAAGRLTREQVARRTLLAEVMAAGGFAGITTEWWHFDHGDRDHVRTGLPRVV